MRLQILLICFLLSMGMTAVARSSDTTGINVEYTVAPEPDWVTPIVSDASDQLSENQISDGVAYMLVDFQTRVPKAGAANTLSPRPDAQRLQKYQHVISRAVNASGVPHIAQISIDFDPSYQTVRLHKLNILRDDRVLDALPNSLISLIQRETELEYSIYDGSKTINIEIEGVRAGDRVEYSFTRIGANPVLNGHFSDSLRLGWSIPVARLHQRLLWPADRELYVKARNTDAHARTRIRDGYREYVWLSTDVPALLSDDNVPAWHDPYPRIWLSDFADWGEVVAWALPLYQLSSEATNVRELAMRIASESSDGEDRILRTLDFVQNEVRYLGIEMGERSHAPSLPGVVLDRRFGDCKDKTQLMLGLLRESGIEAHAALVHSERGRQLPSRLPTPAAFNHVIVRATHDGRHYWLDPTRLHQRGALRSIYQPDFDYALILKAGSHELTPQSLDVSGTHIKSVEETIDLRGDDGEPAVYIVRDRFHRFYADTMRQRFAESSREQIEKDYLNYFAKLFPKIERREAMRVEDDPLNNVFSVVESYTVPDMWTPESDEKYLNIEFYPDAIRDNVQAVGTTRRSMPYAIAHPVSYSHTTRILLSDTSNFEAEDIRVEDEAFHFRKTVASKAGELLIEYTYESRKDFVAAEAIAVFSDNVARVRDLARYAIRKPNPAYLGASRGGKGDINWNAVALTVIALIISVSIGFWLYEYDPPVPPTFRVEEKWRGIQGWLWLVAFNMLLAPVVGLLSLYKFAYLYSNANWRVAAERLGEGGVLLVTMELFGSLLTLVLSVVLALLFFAKRYSLPRLFVITSLGSLAFLGLDAYLVRLVLPGQVPERSIGVLIGVAVGSLVWVLYFLMSRRVKNTFVERKRVAAAGNASRPPATARKAAPQPGLDAAPASASGLEAVAAADSERH